MRNHLKIVYSSDVVTPKSNFESAVKKTTNTIKKIGKGASDRADGVAKSVFFATRMMLFYLMVWFGLVLHFFSGIIVFLCFAGIVAGYIVLAPKDHHMLWVVAGFGFGTWLFAEFYDLLTEFVFPKN